MLGLPAATETEAPPGQTLGAMLGLIALLFLPLCAGGYSGAGYQVGFVLLLVAAAIAWAVGAQRARSAVVALALIGLSTLCLPLWLHPGALLWFNALHIPAAWVVTWVLLREVPNKRQLLLPVLVAGPVLSALYGWWGVLSGGDLSAHNLGSFGLHNAFAGFLLLAWPVAAYAALQAQRLTPRVLYTAAALLLSATLLFTYSRASWLVFGLQLLGCLAWALWRRLRAWGGGERLATGGLAALAALALGLLALPQFRQVLASMVNVQDYSLQGRLRFWQAAWAIFTDHPLAGVGLGNFAYVYPQYQLDWRYYSVDPHSWPLQLLCELGLPGLLLLLAVLAGLAWWLRNLWRAQGGSATALLLTCAVLGSLAHAGVDFDYTFGATTALLGALLALGTHVAQGAHDTQSQPQRPLWQRACVLATVLAWLGAAVIGQGLTLERFTLDRLRETPGLSAEQRTGLLRQAVRFAPYNFRTHYQLASLLALPGREQDLGAAQRELEACLQLNPRYALAWALRGRLAGLGVGDKDLEFALKLDPYNYPEHYYIWASLAGSDDARRERLLLGLERIPLHHPITPQHIRPTWYQLNPMLVSWYAELERLAQSEADRQLYHGRAELFRQYCKNEQASAAGQAAGQPETPESSI